MLCNQHEYMQMFKMDINNTVLPIPFFPDYSVSREGSLFYKDMTITLTEFNERNDLNIPNVTVITLVTFQSLKLPPIYWEQLTVLSNGDFAPENILIGLTEPIESLDFPNYYIIPYYSDYVISRKGVLIRKSTGMLIQPSKAATGYYTFRMTGDDGATGNRLRHRILCMAFKPYRFDIENLDVNHIDGIPGNDQLENLEWCTRSENLNHAYTLGLRNDNHEVSVRDTNTNQVWFFVSCVRAASAFKISPDTVRRLAKTDGNKIFNGLQFRYGALVDDWPEVNESTGDFKVTFPDGRTKLVTGTEAARLADVTLASLRRILREGTNKGKTDIVVERI